MSPSSLNHSPWIKALPLLVASFIVGCGENQEKKEKIIQDTNKSTHRRSSNAATEKEPSISNQAPSINIHPSPPTQQGLAPPPSWTSLSPEQQISDLQAAGTWETEKGNFYAEWGAHDPLSAIAHVEEGDRKSLTALKSAVVSGWAKTDFTGAKNWISTQKKTIERSRYLGMAVKSALLSRGVSHSPDLSEWIASEHDTPVIHVPAAEYAHRWAQQDLSGALNWVEESFPSSSVRRKVTRSLIQEASREGEDALNTLVDWIETQPASDYRDDLLLGYIQETAKKDPSISLQWADVIQDPALRAETMQYCEKLIK